LNSARYAELRRRARHATTIAVVAAAINARSAIHHHASFALSPWLVAELGAAPTPVVGDAFELAVTGFADVDVDVDVTLDLVVVGFAEVDVVLRGCDCLVVGGAATRFVVVGDVVTFGGGVLGVILKSAVAWRCAPDGSFCDATTLFVPPSVPAGTRNCVLKPPFPETAIAVLTVRPLNCSSTSVHGRGQKPDPSATTTVPGGPLAGVKVRSGTAADAGLTGTNQNAATMARSAARFQWARRRRAGTDVTNVRAAVIGFRSSRSHHR
jgi:hypothetical protein